MDERSNFFKRRTRKNNKLNVEECLKLIEAVKKQDVIWNKRTKHCNNKTTLQDAWAVVGSELNMPVKEAKEKWKLVLSGFRVYRARVKRSLVGAADPSEIYKPVWFAYSAMSFMWDGDPCLDAVRISNTHMDGKCTGDPLQDEATGLEKVKLVNDNKNQIVCKNIDELISKPTKTSSSICTKTQTQVGYSPLSGRTSQPLTVRVKQTLEMPVEDPLQIKQTPPAPPSQVKAPPAKPVQNVQSRSLVGKPTLKPASLKSFANLIELELSELSSDYATMAQVDIYKIIGEYKLKDVRRSSARSSQLTASTSIGTKVIQQVEAAPTPVKIEPSQENDDMM